jgi:hypothetical protein
MKPDIFVCPSCGHKHKKPMGLITVIGIVLIPFILIVVLAGQNSQPTSTSQKETQPQENTDWIDTTPLQQTTPQNWLYTEDNDKMRNTTSYWATTNSNEIKDSGFPYQSVQQKIVLRKMAKYGFDVILELSEGQYSCGFDGCSINVKFDNAPIKKYTVQCASSGTNGTLFITNKKGFLTNLKKSSKVMIESEFFERGSETFEFNVDGLNWNH